MDIVKSVPYRPVVFFKFQASATPEAVKALKQHSETYAQSWGL